VRAGAEAAGRSFDEIELNSLTFVVAITDDPRACARTREEQRHDGVEQVASCPIFLTGSPAEIRDGLEKRRERFGLSYIVIQGPTRPWWRSSRADRGAAVREGRADARACAASSSGRACSDNF
jgi:alkanesulfonate monooxygenase SsuD/methylene tetrahydromethanopterin reductase-like flavin-dependent oxidoreductase (luciferase family)